MIEKDEEEDEENVRFGVLVGWFILFKSNVTNHISFITWGPSFARSTKGDGIRPLQELSI